MEKCYCENPNRVVENTHYKNLDFRMILLGDSEGMGIIVLDKQTAVACFEINYCPFCGKFKRKGNALDFDKLTDEIIKKLGQEGVV